MDKLVKIHMGNDWVNFYPDTDTLLLRSKTMMKQELLDAIYLDISEQVKKGIVILPSFMELIIIPKDTEILVPKENLDNG